MVNASHTHTHTHTGFLVHQGVEPGSVVHSHSHVKRPHRNESRLHFHLYGYGTLLENTVIKGGLEGVFYTVHVNDSDVPLPILRLMPGGTDTQACVYLMERRQRGYSGE